MIKRLKFSKIDVVERTGVLMRVHFLDDEGNMYDWAPKWKDVEQMFLKGITTERFNKPESEFLNKFAGTIQEVVEGAQRIDSAYKVYGTFQFYRNQKLIVHDNEEDIDLEIMPGFEVTVDFIDEWLNSTRIIEVLVINDIAIRLRVYSYNDEVEMQYPPPCLPEDLPF